MRTYEYRCKKCARVSAFSMTVEEKEDFIPWCGHCLSRAEDMYQVWSPVIHVWKEGQKPK